mgnify:CR=1 FL=1
MPILVGILPLYSHRNAEFLHNEVPGMSIPESARERMRAGDYGQCIDCGVDIAFERLQALLFGLLHQMPGPSRWAWVGWARNSP